MKKNISINLQGMIFHIEEDGYEQLSHYLAAVKNYFSTYEGHEEITADIEARIAEIFAAKLSPVKQVITREDVQELIAQMGSVKDFQVMEDEEPTSNYSAGQQYNTTNQSANTGSYTKTPNPDGTFARRIYRDETRKVLGGVAAGIANYLNLNILWVRLAFVLLTILFALPGGFPAGIIVIIYILCWVAFPKSYILPETNTKKLFRNSYDKKLGGVASGLALYFGMDVAVIRLLFLISGVVGGFGILVYLALWLIVPEANSITDRVQMEGNPITLSGIEETLKNNLRMQDENGEESKLARLILFPVRLLSQIVQFMARFLNPLINFLVVLIRILAGTLLLLVGGTLIFALFVIAATALRIIDGSAIISFGDIPFSMFAASFPDFGLIAGFFTFLIPCLFLLFLGLSLLLKHFYLRPNVGWPMLGIWVVSLFVLALAVVDFMNDFKEQGEFTVQKSFPVTPYNTVTLKTRRNNEQWGNTSFEMETYPGPDVRIIQTYEANGLTETEAIRNAGMISYRSTQADSVITFDTFFKYKPNAIFRDQKLYVKLLLPQNKQFRISDDLAWRLGGSFAENTDTGNASKRLWKAENNKFICLNCPPPDTTQSDENQTDVTSQDNDTDITSETILLDTDEYGDNTRSYNVANFNKIKASGALHLRIRPGDKFSVQARGDERLIDDIEIEQDGDELTIEQDNGKFNFSFEDQEPILITVTMPTITDLDLSGAVMAEVTGFKTENFNLDASGAVQSLLSLQSQSIRIDENGACKTTLYGSGERITINASGASQVRAHQYKVNEANVELSGVCKARVFVERQLNASVAGPSQVTYHGKVTSIQKNESGMGRIERE